MKWTTPVLCAGLVAGLAAFPLQAGPGEEGPAAAPSEPSAARAADAPARATAGAAARSTAIALRESRTPSGQVHANAGTDARAAASGADPGADRAPAPEARDDRDDRDRRDWRDRRRRRNRYPGPIPTPDEWEPPEGPVRIGLQAGHWRADEAPGELSGLRGGGTRWGSMHESEVNLQIARRAGAMLEEKGYVVDILPAVVPPGYRAHLFISIHADGSNDPRATGYRIAAPRRDATGRADEAVSLLERTYGEATGLPRVPTITRRMRSYYAFNFRRYEHALHPMTIGVIIETGFLTSGRDRRVIVDDPDRAARGIVEAVAAFPYTPVPVAVDRP